MLALEPANKSDCEVPHYKHNFDCYAVMQYNDAALAGEVEVGTNGLTPEFLGVKNDGRLLKTGPCRIYGDVSSKDHQDVIQSTTFTREVTGVGPKNHTGRGGQARTYVKSDPLVASK